MVRTNIPLHFVEERNNSRNSHNIGSISYNSASVGPILQGQPIPLRKKMVGYDIRLPFFHGLTKSEDLDHHWFLCEFLWKVNEV